MEFKQEIVGKCPSCRKQTKFKQLTFVENIAELGSFVGRFLIGRLTKKGESISSLKDGFSDSRYFPNYKCGGCGKTVMQCSSCEEIMPYADTGASHVCGANSSDSAK